MCYVASKILNSSANDSFVKVVLHAPPEAASKWRACEAVRAGSRGARAASASLRVAPRTSRCHLSWTCERCQSTNTECMHACMQDSVKPLAGRFLSIIRSANQPTNQPVAQSISQSRPPLFERSCGAAELQTPQQSISPDSFLTASEGGGEIMLACKGPFQKRLW